jgi:hypothetical protein
MSLERSFCSSSVSKKIDFSLLLLFAFIFSNIAYSGIIISSGSGDWNVGGTWVGGVAPVSTDDVVILTTHTITLTADAGCDDLTINGTGNLVIGSYIFTITGDSPGLAGTVTTSCTSKLVIDDSGGKGEFVIPSSVSVLQKITLNRATGASCDHNLDLASCAPPADSIVLVLTNGILSMNPIGTSKLLMGHTTNGELIQMDIPCSDNAYVDGIVQRAIKGPGFYTFPVGNGGMCRKYGISQNSSVNESVHEVRFTKALPRNYTCYTGSLAGGILLTYSWYQVQISGSNPRRRMYYQDTDFDLTAAQRLDLTLANGSLTALATCPPATAPANEWRTPTTNVTVFDGVGQKYVQFDNANASNNPYWGFGSTNAASPLPVGLIGVEVKCKTNSFFDLVWSTSFEEQNAYFSVEQSNDGQNFEEVGLVQGNGTSDEVNNYSFELESSPQVSYLRLKQVDINGEEHYSRLVSANCSYEIPVGFYPNPTSKLVYLNGLSTEVNIHIFSISGKFVMSSRLSDEFNVMDVSMLEAGVYFIAKENEFLPGKLTIED